MLSVLRFRLFCANWRFPSTRCCGSQHNHAVSSLGDLVIRFFQVFLYVLDRYQSAWETDSFSWPHPVINALLLLPFPNNFLDNIASVCYTAERWGASSQPEDKNAVFFQDSHTGPPFAGHHGKSFANFKVFDYLSWAWSSGMLVFVPCVFCILFTLYEMCTVAEQSWNYFSMSRHFHLCPCD